MAKRCRLPFVLILFTLALHAEVAHAGSVVVNPRLTSDFSIDTSSAESVVRQIIKPGMSDEEKVLACWRFMLDHFYHWHPPQEDSVPGEVHDFAKAMNSYGYGPCFVNTPVLCALWESAGFESRAWRLSGHTVPEVRYNGAWHMLDADARGWHRGQDGQIASVEELARNPSLFLLPTGRSDPYYPFAFPDVVSAPLTPWSQPSKMMDLFHSVEDNQILNHRAVTGHPMHLTLRPRETVILAASNQGAWNRTGRWYLPQHIEKDDRSALQSGPVDITGALGYGNGELLWRPDLTDARTLDLLWLGSGNVKAGKGGLEPDRENNEGLAVFRVWSPYVMVGGRIAMQIGATIVNNPVFEISTDGGYIWGPLTIDKWDLGSGPGSQAAEVDVSSRVAGKYEYLLRVHLGKTPLAAAEFATTFQLAPLSLPKLRPGRNRVTAFRGPDEGHVQLVLGEQQLAEARYHAKASGVMSTGRIEPRNTGEPCAVIYKLTAPAALTAISVGGRLTMERAENQFVEASYSLDQGKTWQPVWRQANTSNSQDPEFEIDKRLSFTNPAKAREALIKFTLQRNSPFCSVTGIRLYGFYREPQPEEKARLNVEIVWQERHDKLWTERKLRLVVSRFPQEVELACDGEEVRLEKISLAPKGDGR